jgi:hypothetical protein
MCRVVCHPFGKYYIVALPDHTSACAVCSDHMRPALASAREPTRAVAGSVLIVPVDGVVVPIAGVGLAAEVRGRCGVYKSLQIPPSSMMENVRYKYLQELNPVRAIAKPASFSVNFGSKRPDIVVA